jgi:rRNA-processing protein FCF1
VVRRRKLAFVCRHDNINDLIGSLLGSKVRLFVPSCAMRELRDLAKNDKAYQAAVALARKFVRHKDGCPPTDTASDIILKQVGTRPSLFALLFTIARRGAVVLHVLA